MAPPAWLAAALVLGAGTAPSRAERPLLADDECGAAGGAGCALSQLQLRVAKRVAAGESRDGAGAGCHTAVEGEACFSEVMWAANEGIRSHPDWYPGLTPQSEVARIQGAIYASSPEKCPMPCLTQSAPLWCSTGPAPRLWGPNYYEGGPVDIKVLSYNLYWWSLYGQRGGNGESAGRLIQANMGPPFDVMGFQECESPTRVLEPVGLLGQYEALLGEHATCMAYNKNAWALVVHGATDVGEDMATKYYGRRGTQWMRLRHFASGKYLFFINHHGPLSVNSGGSCGGWATAQNLIRVTAENAREGDAVVLVGDFNANPASLTIQTLWASMVHVFAGTSFGGVDNIFSNVDRANVVETRILGPGGSDHDAISATIHVGPQAEGLEVISAEPEDASRILMTVARPSQDWGSFWCGLIEDGTDYVFNPGAWSRSLRGGVGDPEWCCRECQSSESCKAWAWRDRAAEAGGRECALSGEPPVSKQAVAGFVAGLSYALAAQKALGAATQAIRRIG